MAGYPTIETKTETDGPRNVLVAVTVYNDFGNLPRKVVYSKIKLRVIVRDDDTVHVDLYTDGSPVELNIDKKALANLVADRLEESGKRG